MLVPGQFASICRASSLVRVCQARAVQDNLLSAAMIMLEQRRRRNQLRFGIRQPLHQLRRDSPAIGVSSPPNQHSEGKPGVMQNLSAASRCGSKDQFHGESCASILQRDGNKVCLAQMITIPGIRQRPAQRIRNFADSGISFDAREWQQKFSFFAARLPSSAMALGLVRVTPRAHGLQRWICSARFADRCGAWGWRALLSQ